MFNKLKDMAVQKMLEKQLGKLPPAQRDMIISAVKENPEFFKKITEEIKALEKQGRNQMAASMEVMRKYQGELQKMLLKK